MKRVLAIAAALFFLSMPANATNWYVDNSVATNGAGSTAAPWKDFANIVWGGTGVLPGDTINISGGTTSQTYTNALIPTAGGSLGNPITITAWIDGTHTGQVILDGAINPGVFPIQIGAALNDFIIQNLTCQNDGDACIWVNGSTTDTIVIQNMLIHTGVGPTNGTAWGIRLQNNAGAVNVLNNTIDTPATTTSAASTAGMTLQGNTGLITISGNTILENNASNGQGAGGAGNDCINLFKTGNTVISDNFCSHPNGGANNLGINIDSMSAGTNALVFNNVVYMPFGDAIANNFAMSQAGFTGTLSYYNNTTYGNGASYLMTIGAAGATINNNIFYQAGSGFGVYTTAAITEDFNLIYAPAGVVGVISGVNKTWAAWQTAGNDTHGVNANPLFTTIANAAGGFALQATSPALNAGTTLSQVTVDFLGVTRPQGTSYDLGAFERVLVSSTSAAGGFLLFDVGGSSAAGPVNIHIPVITGTAQVGQILTESGDTWTTGAITSRFYQWKSAGSNVGTNQNTYIPVSGDVTKTITVAVTATNSSGTSAPATSAATSAVTSGSGPVVAFPGAEGFGAVTRGAAGSSGAKVIHVTTTSDCTSCGSFRDALTASGPRYVVFDTGGTITLSSVIVVSNPYLTIACQTAPGGGIQFTLWAVRFVNTHDIIVRYCKSRAGNTVNGNDFDTDHVGFDVAGSGGATGEVVSPMYNVIIDHTDMEFASRDNMDTWDNVQNLTVQRSIMADGIQSSNVNYGYRGYNLGGTADPGLNSCCDTTGVSIHHNIFAHNNQRNPDIRTVGFVELVNNIMYDYGSFGTQIDNALASNNNTFTSFNNKANVIGNYFQAGTNTSTARLEVTLGTTQNAGLWVLDNISPHRTSATPTTLASNWQVVGDVGPNITCGTYATCSPSTAFQASSAFTMSSYPITTQNHSTSTLTVFNNVLADVGANKNVTSTSRPHINASTDALTLRMINETQNASGSSNTAGYPAGSFITIPTLALGTHPTDTDCDGIPDDVEIAAGLSATHGTCPNGVGGDSLLTNPATGYTYLEDYINGNGGIN